MSDNPVDHGGGWGSNQVDRQEGWGYHLTTQDKGWEYTPQDNRDRNWDRLRPGRSNDWEHNQADPGNDWNHWQLEQNKSWGPTPDEMAKLKGHPKELRCLVDGEWRPWDHFSRKQQKRYYEALRRYGNPLLAAMKSDARCFAHSVNQEAEEMKCRGGCGLIKPMIAFSKSARKMNGSGFCLECQQWIDSCEDGVPPAPAPNSFLAHYYVVNNIKVDDPLPRRQVRHPYVPEPAGVLQNIEEIPEDDGVSLRPVCFEADEKAPGECDCPDEKSCVSITPSSLIARIERNRKLGMSDKMSSSDEHGHHSDAKQSQATDKDGEFPAPTTSIPLRDDYECLDWANPFIGKNVPSLGLVTDNKATMAYWHKLKNLRPSNGPDVSELSLARCGKESSQTKVDRWLARIQSPPSDDGSTDAFEVVSDVAVVSVSSTAGEADTKSQTNMERAFNAWGPVGQFTVQGKAQTTETITALLPSGAQLEQFAKDAQAEALKQQARQEAAINAFFEKGDRSPKRGWARPSQRRTLPIAPPPLRRYQPTPGCPIGPYSTVFTVDGDYSDSD